MATNEVRNQQRSLRRWLRSSTRLVDDLIEADHADDVVQRIHDQQQMAVLLRAVQRLPRAEREALALCVWSQMSYGDAATILGIAEPSVRSRVSWAKSRLAKDLAEVAVLHGPEHATRHDAHARVRREEQ